MVLSLPNAAVSRAVVGEEDGLIHGRRARTVVATSTIGVDVARSLSETLATAGIAFLDAPIAGSMVAARSGQLVTMIDGDEAALEPFRPIAQTYARSIHYRGASVGAAQVTKLANNALTVSGITMLLEVLQMGVRRRRSPPADIDVINEGSGRSFVTDTFVASFFADPDQSLGPVAVASKDAGLSSPRPPRPVRPPRWSPSSRPSSTGSGRTRSRDSTPPSCSAGRRRRRNRSSPDFLLPVVTGTIHPWSWFTTCIPQGDPAAAERTS